ncbi:MAG: hypothetical protein JNM85_01830 [Chthonomonas sp.]|nr:hypothetical protein [Chthonomonas sp.]
MAYQRRGDPRVARAPQLGERLRLLLLLAIFCLLPLGAWAQTGHGTLQGRVFFDSNENGVYNPGEPGIPGLPVIISGPGGVYSPISDANGRYMATDIPTGAYFVEGPNPDGLYPTRPGNNSAVVDVGPGIKDGPDFGYIENCAKIDVKRILWKTDGTGCFTMDVTITNLAPYPIAHIFTVNAPPVIVTSSLSSTANYIPLSTPLAPGQSITLTLTVCGVPQGQPWTWQIQMHDRELTKCCGAFKTIDVPKCDCFQILEQSSVCNADGSVTWCATIQSLDPNALFFLLIAPPPGITINPAVTQLNGVQYGGTFTVCITITGATPGTTLVLPLVLRDKAKECCRKDVPIEIPPCFCPLEGKCMDRKPIYQDSINGTTYGAAFPGTVAVITCWASRQQPAGANYLDMPVVAIQNLNSYQTTAVPLGADWVPTALPRGYHGPISTVNPMGLWNVRNLGTVFGVTLDKYGNIFVTQTSAFGNDYLPQVNPVHGQVYMIQNGTGQIFRYIALPNTSPTPSNPDSFPELGNISYDGDHDQLFVTNLEDGMIYRIKGTGGSATSQGTWLSRYDPADTTAGWQSDVAAGSPAGMVRLGDRVWGVQYHGGRLYFARWRVDRGNPNPSQFNEIWSIGIQPSGSNAGDFDATLQMEFAVPHFQTFNWSMPVSDISFGPDGKMMVAERGLGELSYPAPYGQVNVGVPEWTYPWTAHSARGIEYRCEGTDWIATNLPVHLGYIGPQILYGQSSCESACGGVDYDYSTASVSSLPTSGRRIWFTINGYSTGTIGSPPFVYGIQGLHPTTGGNMANSILNDADGDLNTTAKTALGDVEIPCPPAGVIGGTMTLVGLVGSPHDRYAHLTLTDAAGTVVGEESVLMDASGRFASNLTVGAGEYKVTAKSNCFLRRARLNVTAGNAGELSFVLLPGDINNDNVVDLFDYLLLSENFDRNSSDPGWTTPGPSGISPMETDLNGDGSVDFFDYLLLSQYFEVVGD